jgi:stage V sporulation protein B
MEQIGEVLPAKTRMGRGTLYLMIAQAVFLVGGYIIHFGLGRYLGPGSYGVFGVVLSLVVAVSVPLQSGLPQAAAKYISEDERQVGSVVGGSLRAQLLFSLVIFALYLGLAGPLAALLGDPTLAGYIRFSALLVPVQAIYAMYGGYLNGLRLFGRQAAVIVLPSIVKVMAVFALVFWGFSVNGAIGGYLLAAVIGLLMTRYYCRFLPGGGASDTRRLIRFAVPVVLFSMALTLLMSLDLLAVKAILGEDVKAGFYTSATTLAKVPYFILMGLGFTLLPAISRSTAAGDRELTASYISRSLRYMLLLLVPGTLLVSATARNLVTLVYSGRYAEAGPALSILIFGLAFLAVFYILTTIITASGRPAISFGIALVLVLLDLGLNILLIPIYQLAGAALATTITSAIGLLVSAGYVFRRSGTLVSPKSLARIVVASLAIYAVSLGFPISGLWLLVEYLVLFGLYFGILVLLREIGKEDLEIVKGILPFHD